MREIVSDAIKHGIGVQDVVIEIPKERSFGHYATPIAFSLAKEYRKSPIQIADELCLKLSTNSMFESVESLKGYINVKLSTTYLDSLSTQFLTQKLDFLRGKPKQTTTLLEYVSANPTGPLHIGHARGAIVGNALLQIGRLLGEQITTEYYINDAGNQINLLGISLQLAYKEHIQKLTVEYPEQYYRGEYIVDLAKEIYVQFGDAIFETSNFNQLFVFAKDKMLELIRENLKLLDISFDNYVSEASLYTRWSDIQNRLEVNNATYKKDEKLWLKSSEYGDELDRVVVRENGVPTYLAGDIIYHDDKYQRGFDHYINIWGADHHGYIPRVKASIKFLGYDENKLEVILAQMVLLLKGGEPYKMSKRAGNFILLSDVVEDIGADAIRYIFLSRKVDTPLEFDVDELTKEDSTNPIFYVNYAHARIHSIFANAKMSFADVENTTINSVNGDALDLLFESLLLKDVLIETYKNRAIQKVTEYLYTLSSKVHSFYNSNKIIGSEYQNQYLKVLATSAMSIKLGLEVVGISAKDRM